MKVLSKRAEKVEELVSTGMPEALAMRESGYSPTYSIRSGRHTQAMADLLVRAKEKYQADYVRSSVLGLTGDKAARVLNSIVDSGKDFDKIQAIKVHSQIMSSASQNVQNISISSIFVIPTTQKSDGNWSDKLQSFKNAIDVSKVKDDSKSI